jgi:nucleotide-binding universal stress UspA family protein
MRRKAKDMYRSVVIALDGSPLAAKAVPQGADIARCFDAPLILLRVLPTEKEFEDSGPEPDPQRAEFSADVLGRREYDSLRAQAEGYLESIKKSLRSSGVAVETRLEEGQPAGAILRVANSLDLPLVIITPYGTSASLTPSPDGVFGRVADEVLRQSTVPVLVAKQ